MCVECEAGLLAYKNTCLECSEVSQSLCSLSEWPEALFYYELEQINMPINSPFLLEIDNSYIIQDIGNSYNISGE